MSNSPIGSDEAPGGTKGVQERRDVDLVVRQHPAQLVGGLDRELDPERWRPRAQPGEHRGQSRVHDRLRRAEAHRAERRRGARELVRDPVAEPDQPLGLLEKAAPGRGEPDAAPGTVEEPHAERGLERGDAVGDRGTGTAPAPRRRREKPPWAHDVADDLRVADGEHGGVSLDGDVSCAPHAGSRGARSGVAPGRPESPGESCRAGRGSVARGVHSICTLTRSAA